MSERLPERGIIQSEVVHTVTCYECGCTFQDAGRTKSQFIQELKVLHAWAYYKYKWVCRDCRK